MKDVASLIIAVDGPAAAGKGTLARALADAHGLPYLDTGLLYRAVARRVLESGGTPEGDALSMALDLGTQDLERVDLRLPDVDRAVPVVAAQPLVRAALLDRQRSFAHHNGGVIDGRDIGTVVFPEADVKLFVTASIRTRALRRYRQFHGQVPVEDHVLDVAMAALENRDRQDSQRAVSPLRPADDAVTIHTDDLTASEVFEKANDYVLRCMNKC